jgi:hypothetical protein
MHRPATAPHVIVARRGSSADNTTPQPRDKATWTGTAAVRWDHFPFFGGRSMDPAATAASSGSSPRARAITVDGMPLTTAATPPAAIPSAVLASSGALVAALHTGGDGSSHHVSFPMGEGVILGAEEVAHPVLAEVMQEGLELADLLLERAQLQVD